MIQRKGFGALLSDGVSAAKRNLGKLSANAAIHAGGQELAMHDGRNDPGFAIHAVVEATPGRHTIGAFLYYEMFALWKKVKDLPKVHSFYKKNEKYLASDMNAKMSAANSKFTNILNGSGACLFGAFVGVHRFPIFEWLNADAGWEKTPDNYLNIGYNIQELKQVFNTKHSETLIHDISPRLLGHPKQNNGANKGRQIDLEHIIPKYFSEFGWNKESGQPTTIMTKEILSIYDQSDIKPWPTS